MAQPLPDWLKPVTLRYQDSNQFTTGLMELPITYSGPSIPLKWPFTSVPSNPITTSSSPAASALPSPQVVQFIDGSGPFTILGDVILTATTTAPPAPTISAAISTPPSAAPSSMPTITSSPTVVLVTTIYIAQSTPVPPSPEGSVTQSYNPLALGFVFLLTIVIILILITTGILIKRHRRRRKIADIVRDYDSPPQEVHYEFNSHLYPQNHGGSQTGRQNYLPTSREQQEVPVVTHQHEDLLDGNMKEKPDMQTEFLLTPQSKPIRTESRWAKFIPKLLLFGGNQKRNRPADFVVRHHEPLPQTAPIYVNPYHDPSVNTNTGERVSKWRMQCGSFSSSALKRPSTITSYRNELPPSDKNLFHQQNTPVKDGGLPDNPRSAFSAIQRGDAQLVFSYNQSSTVSGPRGKSQTRAYQALQETTPPASPLKAKSVEAAVYALLDLTSPRRGVAHSPSPQPKRSIIPTKLFKIPSNPSRSFGSKTKSSRSTGKGSASKRYGDLEPPLLVNECNEEEEEKEDDASMSDGHGTDPGDSPLDFITIPLRSPPRCRRGTPSSVTGLTGVEDSMDSAGRSMPPSNASPQAPLPSSAKRVRPKKVSSPALAGRSSIANTTTFGGEGHHIAPLPRVPGPTSLPALLTSRPSIARVPVPQYTAHDPTTSRCTPLFGRAPADRYSPVHLNDSNPSSQGTHLSHPTPLDGTSRSGPDSSDMCSSAVSPTYPQDPSCAPSNQDSSSISPNPPPPLEPPQTTSANGSHNTRNSSAEDEDILFSGYFGSGSIGNFSGVSEMGILDT